MMYTNSRFAYNLRLKADTFGAHSQDDHLLNTVGIIGFTEIRIIYSFSGMSLQIKQMPLWPRGERWSRETAGRSRLPWNTHQPHPHRLEVV